MQHFLKGNRMFSGLGALALLCAALALGGCAAGGASREDSPAAQKAEKIKQLPAEIMKAGDEAARAGEFDRAASLYMQAVELEPSADLWHRLGFIYGRLDKKPLAAQAYASALQIDENHAGAHEDLGLLLIDMKRKEPARLHFQRAVQLDAQRWRSHNALGVLADASGDFVNAFAHYEAALAVNPNSPMLLNNLGYSHYLAGDLDGARDYYQRALSVRPDYRPALSNVALLHARQRKYEQALELMLKIAEKNRAFNDIGYVAMQNGDLDIAESMLREAIRLSPSYYRLAHENLARVEEAQRAR